MWLRPLQATPPAVPCSQSERSPSPGSPTAVRAESGPDGAGFVGPGAEPAVLCVVFKCPLDP